MTDRPEEAGLLAGIDGPRPLPAPLRQRLEDRLLVDQARPLEPDMAGRLSDTLIGAGSRSGRRRPPPRLVAAVVAAGLVMAGGVGFALQQASGGSSHPSTSRVAGPSTGASASVSGPARPPTGAQSPAFNAQLNPAPTTPAPAGSTSSAGTTSPGAGAGRYLPASAPVIASLDPDRGPAGGGTWVTITGQRLAATTTVRFGSVPATRLVVVSASQVRALTPPAPPGPVRVTLSGPSGEAVAGFIYLPG